jgi:hypothetical protein
VKNLLMLATALVAASGLAKAIPACANGNTILSVPGGLTQGTTYTLPGLTCSVAGSIFSNFQIVAAIVPPADTSPFTLALSTNTVGSELDFAITGAPGEDLRLTYQINLGIADMSMTVTGTNSTITELICSSPITSGNICPAGTQLADFAVTSGNTGDSGVFAQVPTDYVFKDIQTGSGLSEFTQTIVPEPMTLSLLSAGLLGLGIFGRRRFSK